MSSIMGTSSIPYTYWLNMEYDKKNPTKFSVTPFFQIDNEIYMGKINLKKMFISLTYFPIKLKINNKISSNQSNPKIFADLILLYHLIKPELVISFLFPTSSG